MKIIVNEEVEPKPFKPVKIEITIETIQELVTLYARFNAPNNKVDDYAPTGRKNMVGGIVELFEIMHGLYQQRK